MAVGPKCAARASSPRPWGCFRHQRIAIRHGQSSPRPWGCFPAGSTRPVHGPVFPTPVGVFPSCTQLTPRPARLPHARGGVSVLDLVRMVRDTSSPRPWGCFHRTHRQRTGRIVFPTPVGVFPRWTSCARRKRSLPHARGGVSRAEALLLASWGSSPRPWGCFPSRPVSRSSTPVFPTPVGVFPDRLCPRPHQPGLPHARGGVSRSLRFWRRPWPSSPRPWGCFRKAFKDMTPEEVFPTPVGVFPPAPRPLCSPWSLPHARGGVSHALSCPMPSIPSSPRPWGCFHAARATSCADHVFPTPVGVFPDYSAAGCAFYRLPHARGGVSRCSTVAFSAPKSSPRPWGCFCCGQGRADSIQVFPTPVGVFLPQKI